MADRTTEANNRLMTGMFRDRQSAEDAYAAASRRGYTKDDVSLLMSDEARRRHFGDAERAETELGSKAAEGAGIGAVAGGGLGAVLGGLAAVGTIALPGSGLLAMGPVAAALLGGATGAVSGGILGGLIGAGIPEERAREYQSGIEEGNIVMGVTPRSREDAEYLEREWQRCRGEQIYCPSWREAA